MLINIIIEIYCFCLIVTGYNYNSHIIIKKQSIIMSQTYLLNTTPSFDDANVLQSLNDKE